MGFVTTEVQGAVEIITIDRPQALNALNPDVLNDLKAAFDAVDQNAVRCIVVTGAGEKSFVAGADIAAMSVMTKAEGEAFGKMGNDIFRSIETFPIPVIAAVNGFALGGGNERHVRPARGGPGHYARLRRHPASGPFGGRRHGQGVGVCSCEHRRRGGFAHWLGEPCLSPG